MRSEQGSGEKVSYFHTSTDALSINLKDNIPVTKKLITPWMNEVTLNSLIKKRKLWNKFKYCVGVC
jgi:hypothetical protein